jgi:L-Ala-D/L-Glu epimerase / N-acetyl-D-glutamate racemase
MGPILRVAVERFPIEGRFVIARGDKREAVAVVCSLSDGDHVGRGEAVPYAHFGETVPAVVAVLEELSGELEIGLEQDQLATRLPAGAARNALDCAMWDLAAQQQRRPVHELAGIGEPRPRATCFTLSLGTPEAMGKRAAAERARPWLKLKLGGDEHDVRRVRAVRASAPHAALVVDANESWDRSRYERIVPELASLGVAMIEQPFPQGQDGELAELPRPVPVCADESCRDRGSIEQLVGRYDAVNIKLDKAGGLSEAIALMHQARAADLAVMVGCMVSSSLSIAPAMLLARDADVVDLDGALLLAHDRADGLRLIDGQLHPSPALWGWPRPSGQSVSA